MSEIKVQYSRYTEPKKMPLDKVYENHLKDMFTQNFIINGRNCYAVFKSGVWSAYIINISKEEYSYFLKVKENDQLGFMPQPHGGWVINYVKLTHNKKLCWPEIIGFECSHENDIRLNDVNTYKEESSFKNIHYIYEELSICTKFLQSIKKRNLLKRKTKTISNIPKKIRIIV